MCLESASTDQCDHHCPIIPADSFYQPVPSNHARAHKKSRYRRLEPSQEEQPATNIHVSAGRGRWQRLHNNFTLFLKMITAFTRSYRIFFTRCLAVHEEDLSQMYYIASGQPLRFPCRNMNTKGATRPYYKPSPMHPSSLHVRKRGGCTTLKG